MKEKFYNSLTFKIGTVITLVEIGTFAVLGAFYIERFHSQVDRQVKIRLELPGTLMNRGLLSLNIVEDKETMEKLVGRDLVELAEGMVVGVNGNIFHALDPEYVGKNMEDFAALEREGRYTEEIADGRDRYLVSVMPLYAVDGQTPFLSVYLKAKINRAQDEKDAITRFFVLGSIASVLLTSIVIILLFRSMISSRISGLASVLRRVEKGDLVARVEAPTSRDEISVAERGVNSMAARLEATIRTLKQHVEGREALIAELEARNAELERITYTVSHDLKNPVVTIKGFLGLVRKDAASGDGERLAADIDRIGAAADQMHRLLDEILELSRIGRVVAPPEKVAFDELAREAAELLSGGIAESGAEVRIAPELPEVYGDHVRLREVLQNLLENALKYMGDQPRPRVEVGARRAGADVVFFVRDNGIGIDPRYQEKVFGLFERLNPEDGEGTGIGLALVKRIVDFHGGRIWIESEGQQGRGSTFCFTLEAPPGVSIMDTQRQQSARRRDGPT